MIGYQMELLMKKMLIIFLLLPISIFAELNMSDVNSILLSIHTSKQLTYYSDKINMDMDKKLKFTSYEDADILLFPKKIVDTKMMIVSSYQELKENQNSIGAIYLKKDRTQIIFIKERLNNKGISIPEKFNNYVIQVCHLNSTCL